MQTATRSTAGQRLTPRRSRLTSPDHALRCAVFTAVDGTLADARTFETGVTAALVERLRRARVPVVLMSVLTLDELEPIANEFGLRDPMVLEGGGAIARWTSRRWVVEPCGPPAEVLLEAVRQIEELSGADLLVCSATADGESVAARQSFGTSFVIERGELADVIRSAASLGFSVRRGRRFLHLCRECDAGDAFVRLRRELRCDVTIALGGSPIDAEFLTQADIPVIVPGPGGDADPELLASVPRARIAPACGPDGWAGAVEEIWTMLRSRTSAVE